VRTGLRCHDDPVLPADGVKEQAWGGRLDSGKRLQREWSWRVHVKGRKRCSDAVKQQNIA
jgi:hypothetical protein